MKREEWIILSMFVIMVGYALLSHTSGQNNLYDQTGQTTVPPGTLRFSSPNPATDPAFYSIDNYPSFVLQLNGDTSNLQSMTITKTNERTGQTETFFLPANRILRDGNLLFPYGDSPHSLLYFDNAGAATGISYSNIGDPYRYAVTLVTTLGTYTTTSPLITLRP